METQHNDSHVSGSQSNESRGSTKAGGTRK